MTTRATPSENPGRRVRPRTVTLPYGDESFRLLVDAVVDYAIFLLDTEGHVLTWNDGAARIKGYAAEEIIGRHFSLFYTPEDRDAGRPEHVLRSAAEGGRYEDEGWRVRKDGTRFWADVIVSSLRNPEGKIYGFAKVTRDLTERRGAQRREQQLIIERERRQAAEEALEARDRFLSIASHELKTPLANVQLAAEAVLYARQHETLSEERMDTSLRRMTRAVERMSILVSELLDVSRLASGQRLETAAVDIAALTSEVVERFRAAPNDRVLVSRLEGVVVACDEVRIEQVIANLIDNALKYSAPDTVVDVAVRPVADGALLEVRDRGIGMAQEAGERFEPFTRGENVRHIPGMGLGLFISGQIVAEHEGTLKVARPDDEVGTVMRVWLPSHRSKEGRE